MFLVYNLRNHVVNINFSLILRDHVFDRQDHYGELSKNPKENEFKGNNYNEIITYI